MSITITANNNPEAKRLYDLTSELTYRTIRLQDNARDSKYCDDVAVDKSYPDILTAIAKVEKLIRYVAEVKELIAKYGVYTEPARVNDRPTRTPKSRKNTTRQSFSFDDLMDSD